MNTKMLEPMLSNATIKAIDGIAKKVRRAKWVKRWNRMEAAEKEQVVSIVIATLTTAVSVIAALRQRRAGSRKSKKRLF